MSTQKTGQASLNVVAESRTRMRASSPGKSTNGVDRNTKGASSSRAPMVPPAVEALRPSQKRADLPQPKEKAPPLSAAAPQKTTTHRQQDDSASISSSESPSPEKPSPYSPATIPRSRAVLRVTAGNVYLDDRTPEKEVDSPRSLAVSRHGTPASAGAVRATSSPTATLSTRSRQQGSLHMPATAKREPTAELPRTTVAPAPKVAQQPRQRDATAKLTAKRPDTHDRKELPSGIVSRPAQITHVPRAHLQQYGAPLDYRRILETKVSLKKPRSAPWSQARSGEDSPDLSPPAVVKAFVTSKPRNKPQRYDGFAGVPAFIGAPDVIIFTPRSATREVSPTIAPGRSGGPADPAAQSPPFLSPTVPSSGSESARSDNAGRMNFLQCWLLSGVAVGTFFLPMGLLLLSYGSTPSSSTRSWTTWTTWTAVGNTTSGSTAPRSRFTLPVHTPTRKAGPAVPAICLRRPRLVSDQNPLLAGSPSIFTAAPKAHIFCLYNNSRYSRLGRYDFGPEQLPLAYCSNIVYWSLSVYDGAVKSRAPRFDLTHGLKKLRESMVNRNIANATILAALGGYIEDGPQFSMLGADSGAMSRFASSVVYLLQTFHLDGVALHWVDPEFGCRGADDKSTLERLVRTIRQSLIASGHRGLVTLILPAEETRYHLSTATVQSVDYIFLEAHFSFPGSLQSLNCKDLATLTNHALRGVPGYTGNKHKICATFSLSPWLLDMQLSGAKTHIFLSNASRYSGSPGRGTVFEMCEEEMCLFSSSSSCVVLKRNVPHSNDGMVRSYVFYDRASIFAITTHDAPDKQFASKDHCLLLYDVDLDNFNTPCLRNRTFNSLHHFHSAMERASTLATPLEAAPTC
ncbi:hypothetical protein HPB49_002204 [Dermacentor silvarum]|uniref:Uncharacterized protein n=1 Tax=Dermacentor silvarum TaxID=543639 RepID=A0ACB8D9X6_DERSI|nr:hypothetical protein HPB49_002204 [Dermacentor silvarum]